MRMYRMVTRKLTSTLPLSVSKALSTSPTPPIWSWCQCVNIMLLIVAFSSCNTVLRCSMYSGTFESPVSINIRLWRFKTKVSLVDTSHSELEKNESSPFPTSQKVCVSALQSHWAWVASQDSYQTRCDSRNCWYFIYRRHSHDKHLIYHNISTW